MDCLVEAEAGTKGCTHVCEWAGGQPGMAPEGQVAYAREQIKWHVCRLCNDIATKARNSRQAMWERIYVVRAAYRAEYQ